jgi:hypothetical protein
MNFGLVKAEVKAETGSDSSLFWRLGGFTLGLVSAWGFHEFGHIIAAEATGTNWEWIWTHSDIRTPSNQDVQIVSMSGFWAEIISREIMFSPLFSRKSSYVVGWITWTIINPILYTMNYELGGSGGDLYEIDKSGGSARVFEALVVTHACLSYVRLMLDPEFQLYLNPNHGGGALVAQFHW